MVKKIIGAIAVVGTIAAVAVINMSGSSNAPSGTFLAADNQDQQCSLISCKIFLEFLKFQYLTKEEYKARLGLFKQNFDYIQKSNAENKDYVLDLNAFADMSDEEYNKRLGFKKNPDLDDDDEDEEQLSEEEPELLQADPVPTSKDWRAEGVVQLQDLLESIFSSAGAMEGAYKIFKQGQLQDFSMQQLVDCSSGYGNQGCGGGLMTNTFNYLKTAKSKGVIGTTGYVNVAKNSNTALRSAIAKQPVSVAIAAGASSFRLYKSGVFSSFISISQELNSCGTGLNHAVLAVGYGSSNGQNYFLIKNSWGTGWGEAGYIKILDN